MRLEQFSDEARFNINKQLSDDFGYRLVIDYFSRSIWMHGPSLYAQANLHTYYILRNKSTDPITVLIGGKKTVPYKKSSDFPLIFE